MEDHQQYLIDMLPFITIYSLSLCLLDDSLRLVMLTSRVQLTASAWGKFA